MSFPVPFRRSGSTGQGQRLGPCPGSMRAVWITAATLALFAADLVPGPGGGGTAAVAAAVTTHAASEEIMVDGIPHVRNGEVPREGTVTLTPQELWRAGGEEDEHFFGVISAALADSAGNIYLLDRQLSEVAVYSSDGRFLRTLSREGEGPGEVRRPVDMLWMPTGTSAS